MQERNAPGAHPPDHHQHITMHPPGAAHAAEASEELRATAVHAHPQMAHDGLGAHGAHAAHGDKHAGHSEAMFSRRFWVSWR